MSCVLRSSLHLSLLCQRMPVAKGFALSDICTLLRVKTGWIQPHWGRFYSIMTDFYLLALVIHLVMLRTTCCSAAAEC